ncbi:hypothetical protein [Burkholderia gladioli]|uniref:hypothetical protein n=1 Tax=Burkholderia gladioli TaxID=28095 RepID=UPI00286F7BE7|nr:hypothetical protein [Burkholderia gladioli]
MATLSKYTTGFAANMFDAVWAQGGVQGEWIPDPSTRYALEGGFSAEPTALFGGVPVTASIAAKGLMQNGPTLVKATATANIDGFIIASKMYHAVVEAQDTAPQVAKGDAVHFARIGSRVRLYVQVDPAFAETLFGAASDTALGFDLVAQKLTAQSTTVATTVNLPAGVIVESVFENGIILNYSTANDTVTYGTGPVAVIRL